MQTATPTRSILVTVGTDEAVTSVALAVVPCEGLSIVSIPLDAATIAAIVDTGRIELTLGTDHPPNLRVRA